MSRRDRLSIRPGMPSNESTSDRSNNHHAPPRKQAQAIKAAALLHRLHHPGPNIRLVRDERDEVDISTQALDAAREQYEAQSKIAADSQEEEQYEKHNEHLPVESNDPDRLPLRSANPRSNNPRGNNQRREMSTFRKTNFNQPSPASPGIITDPTDPRWVLAIRTSESLQGTILGPEKRERLVKIGKMMGLTAFDANLVIAIVQDQARRGYAPEYCPTAGEAQLAMVPLPKRDASETEARTRRIGIICGVISVLVGIELMLLKWLFS